MSKPRRKITPEEAQELLPDGDVVHTFRAKDTLLIGADWPKSRILERFKTHGVELSGDNARSMNHGLCSLDDTGWLFIETRREKR
jgi:hypothetical protein